jgi:hypothetical protein
MAGSQLAEMRDYRRLFVGDRQPQSHNHPTLSQPGTQEGLIGVNGIASQNLVPD